MAKRGSSDAKRPNRSAAASRPACFVMMPITDPPGYAPGHFRRVYDDIFVPACEKAGYKAVRADDIRQTNLIHVDVLHKAVESPMALCDLSSRNPNVLFELGLRVAFDRPVLLVRDGGTGDLFDIAPLRYTEYRPERTYHQVIEDQNAIANALRDTHASVRDWGVANSMIRLLALPSGAKLPELKEDSTTSLLLLMRAQIEELARDVRLLREAQGGAANRTGPANGAGERNGFGKALAKNGKAGVEAPG